jgi:hypothetical protein
MEAAMSFMMNRAIAVDVPRIPGVEACLVS